MDSSFFLWGGPGFAQTPIPRDLPLPPPLDRDLLSAGLVASFVLHILFVNFMLGGALASFWHEVRGWMRNDPDEDAVARELSSTITVSKSLAVVLGVGPLLFMNVLYSTYFYAANILTGVAWMAIVPMAATAFLLLYLHKYTWDSWRKAKALHIAVVGVACGLLLTIPLVFLANINLMLFPERWAEVRGFASAALLPNALPRWLHFLLASLAATGLLCVFHFGRKDAAFYDRLARLRRPDLVRRGYRLAFYASLLQFGAGPLVLFTLPPKGLTWLPIADLAVGVGLAAAAVASLYVEQRASDERIGRGFGRICILLGGTVVFMALTRHFYREESLADHRAAVAEATREFLRRSESAWENRSLADANLSPGERAFRNYCSACHAVDKVSAAPSVREIAELYRGKPEAIVAWALAPGRRRPQFAARPMPSMAHLGAPTLRTVAEFMLDAGGTGPAASPSTTSSSPAAATSAAPTSARTAAATPSR